MPPDPQLFAIIPINGKPPPDALCHGSISQVMEYIEQSTARVEAEQRLSRAQEQLKSDAEALQSAQRLTVDALPRLTAMGDALVAAREKQHRRDAAAKKAADEAAEAQRVEDLLNSLPDPDDPDATSGDDGELQTLPTPLDPDRFAEHED